MQVAQNKAKKATLGIWLQGRKQRYVRAYIEKKNKKMKSTKNKKYNTNRQFNFTFTEKKKNIKNFIEALTFLL